MSEPNITVTQKGADRLRKGHLWIYRSDIRQADAEQGAIVRLIDQRGNFLGRAFYSDRSQIAIRLLTREDVPIDRAFWRQRFVAAAALRERVVHDTDCYRLVYGEADLLPSLIVDRYGDYFSIQTLSQGTERQKPIFVELLNELFSPKGIIERNDPKVRLLEGLDQVVSVVSGDVPQDLEAHENGITFHYDLYHGQKTGAFLDQRENHRSAREYASGEILDCFSYTGGFALTVATQSPQADTSAVVREVEAVDMSSAAVEAARRNQGLNQIKNVAFREGNVFDLLKHYDDVDRQFDMVILDPPAFAKSRENIDAAQRGYKEINLRALRILRPGGYLVTCSCSHHVSEALFAQIIADAAVDAKRLINVIERRTQARDHPILLTMPETMYLKCFIIRRL